MRDYRYMTLDVFAEERFGGNPLAVFPEAEGLGDREMLALSAEMNLSETTFVLPPLDSANTARVRIFNRTEEMPFAGHPNVGTGVALRMLGLVEGDMLRFEEIAGHVEVRLAEGGAEIDAPQPLTIRGALPVDAVACCIGVEPRAVIVGGHPPLRASTGIEFVFVEVAADALGRATQDLGAFRQVSAAHPELGSRLSILLYAQDGAGVRARMFAPLVGTWEDAATGSANATLAALRLSLTGGATIDYTAIQGVEMGRPSRLHVGATATPDGIRARVGGTCIKVFEGKVRL